MGCSSHMVRPLGSRSDILMNLNTSPCESVSVVKVECLLSKRILPKFGRVNGIMWDTT